MGSFNDIYLHLNGIAKDLDSKMPSLIATTAMVELEAVWKERIFDRGEKTDGSKIGNYSTEPAYYSKDQFIRKSAFKAQGQKGFKGEKITYNKTTGTAKISKTNPKTMFLQGGYSEFRDIQGRETKHINLKYSGSEERAFRVYKFGNEVVFGNADEMENKKITGQEEKLGEIFDLSLAEQEFLNKEILNQSIIVSNGSK